MRRTTFSTSASMASVPARIWRAASGSRLPAPCRRNWSLAQKTGERAGRGRGGEGLASALRVPRRGSCSGPRLGSRIPASTGRKICVRTVHNVRTFVFRCVRPDGRLRLIVRTIQPTLHTHVIDGLRVRTVRTVRTVAIPLFSGKQLDETVALAIRALVECDVDPGSAERCSRASQPTRKRSR